jgi:hypothetical protein
LARKLIRLVADDLENMDVAEKTLRILRAHLVRRGMDKTHELVINPNDFKAGHYVIGLYVK